jgi:hypothetical protein
MPHERFVRTSTARPEKEAGAPFMMSRYVATGVLAAAATILISGSCEYALFSDTSSSKEPKTATGETRVLLLR